MSKQSWKNITTYAAAPMLAALLVRIAFYASWANSPFHLYHTIIGLDMRKFLLWGTGLADGHCRFTMYRFLVAIVSLFTDPANLATGVVIAQLALGVGTTGLTVYIFRRLFHNRSGAVLAGILFALYAPPLIYETQILKETLYLFLTTLSLAAAISAAAGRPSAKSAAICGATAIFPFLVRFSGILWFICVCIWFSAARFKRNSSWKTLAPFIAGSLLMLSLVFGFELSQGRSPLPFFTPNAGYILKVGAKKKLNDLSPPSGNMKKITIRCRGMEIETDNAEKGRGGELSNDDPAADKNGFSSAMRFTERYFSKTRYIFTGAEMPNNVNFYFEHSKLLPLRILIPPGFLVPIGLAGLILMLLTSSYRGRAAPLLWLLLAFSVPMIIFAPLARYKLVLAPTLCVSAAFLVTKVLREIRGRNWQALAKVCATIVAACLFSAILAPPLIIRNSDLKAYAVAATRRPVRLMTAGRFADARVILAPLAAENPGNGYIRVEYASSLLGTGDYRKAGGVLKTMPYTPDRRLAARINFEAAEAYRLQGNTIHALKCYRGAKRLGIAGFRGKATEHWLKKLREFR